MIANINQVNIAYYIPQLIDEYLIFLTVFENSLFLLLDELFLSQWQYKLPKEHDQTVLRG